MPPYFKTLPITKSYSISYPFIHTYSPPSSGMTVKTRSKHISKPLVDLQLDVEQQGSKTLPTDFISSKTPPHPQPQRYQLSKPESDGSRVSRQNPLLFDLEYNGWNRENNLPSTFIDASDLTNQTPTSPNSTHRKTLPYPQPQTHLI